MEKKSIVPPTGEYNSWYSKFVLPQGLEGKVSSAGWTKGSEGFIQQTFLGASIRSFNVSAGFGDSASTLSVELINDEYNKSDSTNLGIGDDVYHNGQYDEFAPPPVGSPVFFKFGKNFADIEQAWRKTFDDIYGYNTVEKITVTEKVLSSFDGIPPYHFYNLEKSKQTNQLYFEDMSDYYDPVKNHPGRGINHFVFGGILQSATQNKGQEGNPLFSVQMVDPREILSNCSVILKNYAGSIFGNKNFFNVFGFLEHDISDELKFNIETKRIPGFSTGPIATAENWFTTTPFAAKTHNNLEKVVDPSNGNIFYYGNDVYRFPKPIGFVENEFPEFFPMTGQGFARVSDQGIPWYRVRQALEALFGYNGALPQEYIDAGYGGPINFRGFNYVADFSGIPLEKIPQMYFLDYEKIDLLSLAQELCETISHDMFVSLLPIIDHPACKFLYDYNNYWIQEALKFDEGSVDRNLRLGKVISGIIRIDAINRSDAPAPGTIKAYLDNLLQRGIPVKNQDLGYELSNVETDKIVVGAQEVGMYFFNTLKDRDMQQVRRKNAGLTNGVEFFQSEQWSLHTMLKQQLLPFYGFLGKDAVTIPRGFGAYQQIMLDASSLKAYGVGNYYVATEMELRAALVSYERWVDFLLSYNNIYIDELTGNQRVLFDEDLAEIKEIKDAAKEILDQYGEQAAWVNSQFGVSVPRSVFNSDKNYMGGDGFPANRCNPPYGYPLYYQRASAIGIPEAGNAGVRAAFDIIRLATAEKEEATGVFQKMIDKNKAELDRAIVNLEKRKDGLTEEDTENKENINRLIEKIKQEQKRLDDLRNNKDLQEDTADVENFVTDNAQLYILLQNAGKKTAKNARKIYDFVRSIAEKHLGKTFLVKIPKACNVYYSHGIELWNNNTFNIRRGPFGFKPHSTNSNIGYYSNNLIETDFRINFIRSLVNDSDYFEHYIYNSNGAYYTTGALKNNFNPISDKWEFNYEPEPQGGFFDFNFQNAGVATFLVPQDITNFVENNRFQCYVRFNDSQFLNFSEISKDSFTQQAYSNNGFIPDVLEELENVSSESNKAFDQYGPEMTLNPQRTVAFVKCEIDPKFYMAPRVIDINTNVWARKVKYLPNFSPLQITKNRVQEDNSRIYSRSFQEDENAQEVKTAIQEEVTISYQYPIFYIKNGGLDGTQVLNSDFLRYYDPYTNSNLIDTNNLDPDHVYAIITLPSRVSSNLQTRFNDSSFNSFNSRMFKSLMTVDVVKGVPGFNKPPTKTGPLLEIQIGDENFDKAKDAYYAAFQKLAFIDLHRRLSYETPSPVYPDVVALPLMSKERCYGPWVSTSIVNSAGDTRLRYSDIGGKVDFVKEENLAPWTYGGYQLMNEAGSLMAQFSNSLLLYSERGGFVIPDAPLGISLAKALQVGGPLVTSISVDVNSIEVSTTIKMDLYTSKFGKLQKQKEKSIGAIVRERQKIVDRTNADIRRGMGKNRSNANVAQILLNAGGSILSNKINSAKLQENFTDIEQGFKPTNNILIEVQTLESDLRKVGTSNETISSTQVNTNGAFVDNNFLIEGQSLVYTSESQSQMQNNVATVNIGEILSVVPTVEHPFILPIQNSNRASLIQEINIGQSELPT